MLEPEPNKIEDICPKCKGKVIIYIYPDKEYEIDCENGCELSAEDFP